MPNNLPETKQVQLTPVEQLKSSLDNPWVKSQFNAALGEHADTFLASVMSVYSTTPGLHKCKTGDVIREALKAAVMKLPIVPGLGFASIVPRKNGKTNQIEPNFQIDYKGNIQLTQRTGLLRAMNDGPVYEGQTVEKNWLTGDVKISGVPKGDKVIGFFAYFRLSNGFEKADYWTKEEVLRHAKKYSDGFNAGLKVWSEKPGGEFNKMASKTVLNSLLKKYAPKSVEWVAAASLDSVQNDIFGPKPIEDFTEEEPEVIDTDFTHVEEQPKTQPQKQEEKPEVQPETQPEDTGTDELVYT